jgi:hypothetical protein
MDVIHPMAKQDTPSMTCDATDITKVHFNILPLPGQCALLRRFPPPIQLHVPTQEQFGPQVQFEPQTQYGLPQGAALIA